VIHNRPPQGATLDRSHPLSRGCVLALPLNEPGVGHFRNLADGGLWLPDFASAWVRDRIGIRGVSLTGQSILTGPSRARANPEFTLELLVLRVTPGTGASDLVACNTNVSSITSSAGSDTFNGLASQSWAAADGFTTIGGWQQIIQRGFNLGPAAATFDAWQSGRALARKIPGITLGDTSAPSRIGAGVSTLVDDVIGWVRLWERALSDAEIASLQSGRWPNIASTRLPAIAESASTDVPLDLPATAGFAPSHAAATASVSVVVGFSAKAWQPSHTAASGNALVSSAGAAVQPTRGQAVGSARIDFAANAAGPTRSAAAGTSQARFTGRASQLLRSASAFTLAVSSAAKGFAPSSARGRASPTVLTFVATARQPANAAAIATAIARIVGDADQPQWSAGSASSPVGFTAAARQPGHSAGAISNRATFVADGEQPAHSSVVATVSAPFSARANAPGQAMSWGTARATFAAVTSQPSDAATELDTSFIDAFAWPTTTILSEPLFCYAIPD
jgi:hypothetical protein